MILLRQKLYTKMRLQKKYVTKAIENVTNPDKAKKYIKLVNDSSKMNKGAKKMTTAVNKAVSRTSAKTGLSRDAVTDRLKDLVG